MIRRKLTRIEVTLDDTKELDEFFNKTTSQNAAFSISSTLTTPKLSFFQKQLNFTSGRNSQGAELNPTNNNNNNTNIDSSIEFSVPIITNINNNINNNNNNNSEGGDANITETQDRLSFNPQPYNPSSRFQINPQ
jgi:hypothetical protein